MKILETFVPTHVAESLSTTFVHSLWQLAALALIAMAVMALLPRAASRSRYLLGIGTLVMMVALPVATFLFVYEPAAPVETIAMSMETEFEGVPSGEVLIAAVQESPEQEFLPGLASFITENSYWILGLWMLGALVLFARFCLAYAQVQTLRKRGTYGVDAAVQRSFEAMIRELGLRRRINLLTSDRIDTPMVIGVLRPVILVPAGLFAGLSTEQVECILLHELAHIRRWDYMVNLVQSGVEILFFYHPAVWWISRIVREERENCCDAFVLAEKPDQITYARALLNLETMRRQPGLAMASNGGDLLNRIRRITGGEPVPRRTYSRGLFVGAFLLTLVVLVSGAGGEQAQAALPYVNELSPELAFVEDQMPPKVVRAEEEEEEEVAAFDAMHEATETAEEALQTQQKPCSRLGQFLWQLESVRPKLDCSSKHLRTSMARLGEELEAGLGQLEMSLASMAQDSPIKKMILMDGASEVEISFDDRGEVASVKRDGRVVPNAEADAYLRDAGRALRQPGMPVPPTMDGADMAAMPVPPTIGALPAMPRLPRILNPQSEEFEVEMERFGAEMERWGEEFAQQFKEEEWEAFGEEMERWAEGFAGKFEEQDWEAFGEEMERWGESFGAEMEAKLEVEADRLERMAERMEAKMEAEADRMEREAEEEAMIHEREANRNLKAVDVLRRNLERDGLIDQDDSFKVQINEDELRINGKKQPDIVRRKYQRLIEDQFGVEVEEDMIRIEQKRNKTVIEN